MQVIRTKNMLSRRGAEENFTGTVWQQVMVDIPAPGMKVLLVFFEPGARTAWHTHPEGQVLYVVAGNGRVKKVDEAGEQAYEIGPGDIVHIAPGEKHWHGASPKSVMAHIAINPNNTGKETHWLEKVQDEDYTRGFD